MSDADDKISIEILQAYLKIPSVTNETDYEDCIKFAKCLACSAGLEFSTMCMGNSPIGVVKWPGTDKCAKAIVCNTHMNVAPVIEEMWPHPPFAAEIDECCNIWGRGTQKPKMMAIQYVEAIKRIKNMGCTCKRTIIVLFMPDQFTLPADQMKCFFQSNEMKCLNIGLWLDRAYASPCKKAFSCYYAQKHLAHVEFHIKGTAFPYYLNGPDPACPKLCKLITQVYEYRQCQLDLSDGQKDCPDHVTVNVTNITWPAMGNTLPLWYVVTVKAFLPVDYDIEEWRKILQGWCCNVGEDCCLKEILMEKVDIPTDINSVGMPFYKLIQETAHDMGFDLQTRVNPGISQARFARHLGIPAFGFSCLNGTNVESHGQNEHIEATKFLRGIEFYTKLFPKLGNMDDC